MLNLEARSFLTCSGVNFDCELDPGGATPVEPASSNLSVPRLHAAWAPGMKSKKSFEGRTCRDESDCRCCRGGRMIQVFEQE